MTRRIVLFRGVNVGGRNRRAKEDFAVRGKSLYLFAPDGLTVSKIAERIVRVLGVRTTARNWNTDKALKAPAEAR